MEIDRSRLQRCIAITNGKGGVGKTTTASHTAGLLALAGLKTLAVDLDPQGNLGEDLGYGNDGRSDEGRALCRAVQDGEPPKVMKDVRENLDVLAGGERLEELVGVLEVRRRKSFEDATLSLAHCLSIAEESYDVIVMDCPPGEPQLQELALGAARWMVIPYKSDASSRKGLRRVAARMQVVQQVNPDLRLLAAVLYGTGSSATRIRQKAKDELREDLGQDAPILDTVIRHLEAPAKDVRDYGQLVFELERDAAAAPKWYERLRSQTPADDAPPVPSATATGLADDFRSLTQELFQRLVAAEAAA